MAMDYDYDLIVIGAGIAGFVSAVTAKGLGRRVAIVEKRKAGGNCTNFTCIPSKTLVRMAHLNREMALMRQLGVTVPEPAVPDSENIMARIRSVVQSAYEKDLPETFVKMGIDVLTGTASFVDSHHIKLNESALSAETFIIASGTRPLVPPIPGLRDLEYLTNETVYDLERLPKSLVILGGGVDGIEYASAFGRLGVNVTVVEMAPRLLPMADRELVNQLIDVLTNDGIHFLTGAKAEGVWKHGGHFVLTYSYEDGREGEVEAERVLVAIGRRPDLDGLSLDKAGVRFGPKGIATDSKLRTSAPNIYACGDIAGPYQLASTAEYQGMLAATNASLPLKRSVDYENNVYVVFTEPPLAYLGLTEEQAHGKYGDRLRVYRFDYSNMRRALVDDTRTGSAKFLCDGRGRLVGVHILGEAAAEVIHEAQVIKAFRRPLHAVKNVTHAYPTYSQALVGRAGQLAYLDKMERSFAVRTALGLLPGISNRLNLARERLAESPPAFPCGSEPPDQAVVFEKNPDGRASVAVLPAEVVNAGIRAMRDGCAGARFILLDFSKVRRMNGLGASLLVKVVSECKGQEQTVGAFGIGPGLRDVLKVTELDQGITLYESRGAAMAAAGLSIAQGEPETGREGSFDTSCWAKPVAELAISPISGSARKLNVRGRRPVGPVNGFGCLWEKAYHLHISDGSIGPEEAVGELKRNWVALQPSRNRFYPPASGITPGAVVPLDAMTPGGPLSTGVMVLYADKNSFTFCCPFGHPESGFISFSAHREEGKTTVQILGLARANDPIYEAAFRVAGSREQVRIWRHVLTSLALYLGVRPEISYTAQCIDPRLRWSQAANVWQNAQVRTLLGEPLWWWARLSGGRGAR